MLSDKPIYVGVNSYFDAKKSGGLARTEMRFGDSYVPPGGFGAVGVADMRILEHYNTEILDKIGDGDFLLLNSSKSTLDALKTHTGNNNVYYIDLEAILGNSKSNFHFCYAMAICLHKEGKITN